METVTYSVGAEEVRFVLDAGAALDGLARLDLGRYRRLAVLIDPDVERLWGALLSERLAPWASRIVRLPGGAGEKAKTLAAYGRIVAGLAQAGINRADALVAVGGGALQDVTGFVAATYMRGIDLVAVPTTLIGMADAITGGKTCLNVDDQKNLVGTLTFPTVSYINPAFLRTLPWAEVRQGVAEIFKYGLLGDPVILKLLRGQRWGEGESPIALLKRVIAVRLRLRATDPLASNLGHTFGHALEALSRYLLKHGDAISVGIGLALALAVERGLAQWSLLATATAEMRRLGLPLTCTLDATPDDVTELMCRDKKALGEEVGLVLVTDVGRPYRTPEGSPFLRVTAADLRTFLARHIRAGSIGISSATLTNVEKE